jgi:hypothetical protein
MAIFDLPKRTALGRVIPKNAFDKFTNSKQKKAMSALIKRITWQHKISTTTTNLPSKEIEEIQVFLIELKSKNDLKSILEIINKAITYHIIFILKYDEEIRISTAAKHLHLHKKNEAVIDCVFQTNWFQLSKNDINLNLQESLEVTYIDLCSQISSYSFTQKNYSNFVEKAIQLKSLESQIQQLEKQIQKEQQFNLKVELNIKLMGLRKKLQIAIASN